LRRKSQEIHVAIDLAASPCIPVPHNKRENAMIPSRRRESRPEIEQPTASELAERIRKLRWMGMEDEARKLQGELSRVEKGDCVLAAPRETD
jgi:hypothetical protein